jgi:hypothetical protein
MSGLWDVLVGAVAVSVVAVATVLLARRLAEQSGPEAG